MNMHAIQNGLADATRDAAKRISTPAYDLRDDVASMTDADMIRYYRHTGRILVWSGGSERTVFGCPRVNWLARAWHDFAHIQSGVCNRNYGPLGCFEPIAEYRVADWQCIGIGDRLARLVQIEVSGQAKHFADTGRFASDQLVFYTSFS